MGEIERLTCPNENCGTFPMDAELVKKLRRTGETFTCPGGHSQHFGETTETRLRGRVEELERRLEREERRRENLEETIEQYREQYQAERGEKNAIRKTLLPEAGGVVELDGDVWSWGCECGGYAYSTFGSEREARGAYGNHRDGDACSLDAERVTA